ncbi:MAG: hypothetical protein WC670_18920 [Pseudolabrys sp.]|jgi:hypothetical protein
MSIRVKHIRGTTAEVESVTPLEGELGYDTTRKEAHLGDGATAGGMRLSKKNVVEIVSPAQITADQNDYAPTNLKHAGALILNSDAARSITGMVPNTVTDTTDGVTRQIYNGGAFNITLKDQSGSSTAANRFDLNSADVVLLPKTTITLRYSNAASRWLVVGSNVGSAVASLGVVARTLAGSALGISMVNGTLTESHAGGAVTFAIKTLAGADPSVADPVLVLVRSATAANGDYSMLTLTAATSLTVSSGSSLGTTNNAAFRLWLVGFDDAGTFRLGVINAGLGVYAQQVVLPHFLSTSSAEGGAGNADSATTYYTGTAVASKPLAVLGYADYPAGLAAAGTWSVSPTTLQLYHAGIPLPGTDTAAGIRNNGFVLVNGKVETSVGASALTITIKTLAGFPPNVFDQVYVLFRNATAAAGDFSVMTLTAATTLTVSSGSTLGTANATPFRLWLVGFNDAGTFRLGVINCLSGTSIFPLGQFPIASSTAEGGAGGADSPHVFYSGSAVAAKAYAVLGYLSFESGLATAGAWSAVPTRMQLFGHGVPLPGTEIQNARTDSGALATGTTTIPLDDTIPQNTEGDEYLSRAITPTSAANLLRLRCEAVVAHGSGPSAIIGAIFRDAVASALAADIVYFYVAGVTNRITLEIDALAGAAASTTFKLRAGTTSGGTLTFNGSAGGRLMGGLMNSFMRVREIMT